MAKAISTIGFMRNGTLHSSRTKAIEALNEQLETNSTNQDGSIILSRYKTNLGVKTILGLVCNIDGFKSIQLFEGHDVLTKKKKSNLNYEELYKEANSN